MNKGNEYIPGKCPNCNKPGSAIMLSSSWGHDVLCCSQQCGIEFGTKLIASEKWRKAQRLQDQAWELMRECKRGDL
jgi:hypothetical protein